MITWIRMIMMSNKVLNTLLIIMAIVFLPIFAWLALLDTSDMAGCGIERQNPELVKGENK